MLRTAFSMLRPVGLLAALATCVASPASAHAQRLGNGGGLRGGFLSGGGLRGGGGNGGYRGGYRSGGYIDPWYSTNGVIMDGSAPIVYGDASVPTGVAQNPAIQRQSFYMPANTQSTTVAVRVPPNAEVFFDGDATRQRGPERIYQSPPLEAGKDYRYEVKARWNENGKAVEQTRSIAVRAGGKTDVDFSRPESAPAPKSEKGDK
jgi:uncharacterized protein (TIGR03000 family)